MGRLVGPKREAAALLTSTDLRDRFGQTTRQWSEISGEVLSVGVQPLGADLAQRLGLSLEVERLRVTVWPAHMATTADRLRLREREWQIIHVEAWPSYTLLIVEGA